MLRAKLDAFVITTGYPDALRDYGAFGGAARAMIGVNYFCRPPPPVLPQLEMLPDCLTKDRTGGLGSFGRGTPLWQFKGTVALGSRGGWREVSRSLRSRFLEKTGTHPATERRRRYLRRKPRARHQHSGADHRVRNADTAWWSHMLSGIRTRVIRGLGERDLVAPGSRRHCRGASSEHEATSGEASPFLDSPLRRPQ